MNNKNEIKRSTDKVNGKEENCMICPARKRIFYIEMYLHAAYERVKKMIDVASINGISSFFTAIVFMYGI